MEPALTGIPADCTLTALTQKEFGGDLEFASGCLWLGRVSFEEARKCQQHCVELRKGRLLPDVLLCCEHEPTLSLGRRSDLSEAGLDRASWTRLGVTVVQSDRGGGATYHGPGQLLLYPVVSLRDRGLGVRGFVLRGLSAIAQVLVELGIDARPGLDPAGVWVDGRKVAFVGLRIRNGISDHGFSLNVNCDLSNFKRFVPCGLSRIEISSIFRETGSSNFCLETLGRRVAHRFWEGLGGRDR